MNSIKITNNHIFAITASFSCGSAILVIPASSAGFAKQDAWIAMIVAQIVGLFEIGILCLLWSKYPGITFVQMIGIIFGKWIGFIIACVFVLFCILSGTQTLWYIGNFISVQAMPETPDFFINMVFWATVVIALMYGIETLARSYEIFLPLVSILFILSMLLVLPNVKIYNLLPIFEEGITPLLKSTFNLWTYILFPSVVLLMVFPVYSDNTLKARLSFVKGYLWGGFMVFDAILMSILVLGSRITANSEFTVYLLAKEISLGIIFTRLEFIVAAIWIITLLSRVFFYFYAGVLGLSQLLQLKDHKRVILPIALIVLSFIDVVYPDTLYQTSWDKYVWPFSITTFGVFLPLSMVIGYYIKKLSADCNNGGQV